MFTDTAPPAPIVPSFSRKNPFPSPLLQRRRLDGPGSEKATFHYHSAKHFRLPDDPEAPIIMIGVGTGLAPYRGYLQEREAVAAPGRNWLFFGEQRRAANFYHEKEFAAYVASGLLTRFDTAFSRDQAGKIYVQHRIREQGREVWSWLDDGAYIYVCGDAERMAPDVDAAIHAVVEEHGGMTKDAAAEYVAGLRSQKRYRRDVY